MESLHCLQMIAKQHRQRNTSIKYSDPDKSYETAVPKVTIRNTKEFIWQSTYTTAIGVRIGGPLHTPAATAIYKLGSLHMHKREFKSTYKPTVLVYLTGVHEYKNYWHRHTGPCAM